MINALEASYVNGTALFGAIAGLASLALVVFLYVGKRWWFRGVGDISSCCNDICPPITSSSTIQSAANIPSRHTQKLVKTFSFDMGDSSSESEIGACNEISQEQKLQKNANNSSTSPALESKEQDYLSLCETGKAGFVNDNNSSYRCTTPNSLDDKNPPVATDHFETVEQFNGVIRVYDLKESKSQRQHLNCCNNIHEMEDCVVTVMQGEEDTENDEIVSNLECERMEQDAMQILKCGQLEVALHYDAPMRKMTVHVLQAKDVPSRDRGQPTNTQIRLLLLPNKKQKHKTKIRSGETPQYLESFLFHRINPEDVYSMGLRFRLYGCERMRRERLIGEAIVQFANVNLEFESNFWINLEPRANLSLQKCTNVSFSQLDQTEQNHSLQLEGIPELLLGLAYNATTGRLNVEVVKGSHFRKFSANRAPDTYVKLHLVSSTGQQLGYSKTTVRRGQPNPLFKETFIFQVALFQLADVTLMISVYNRKGVTKKKEMVGWFSLGLNSSGAEELSHWMDMKEYQQEQISRWHVLIHS